MPNLIQNNPTNRIVFSSNPIDFKFILESYQKNYVQTLLIFYLYSLKRNRNFWNKLIWIREIQKITTVYSYGLRRPTHWDAAVRAEKNFGENHWCFGTKTIPIKISIKIYETDVYQRYMQLSWKCLTAGAKICLKWNL